MVQKKRFFEALNYYLDLGIKQLLERFAYQCTKRARDFQFLYSQGVWRGGETLQPEDSVASILKTRDVKYWFYRSCGMFSSFNRKASWGR